MYRRYWFLLLTAPAVLLLGAFVLPAQKPVEIVLQDVPHFISPHNFYVAEVTDDRPERGAIGKLIAFPGGTSAGGTIPVDFSGGGLAAVKRFFDRGASRDTSLQPAIIHVKKFKVIETATTRGVLQGQIKLQLGFDVMTGVTAQHLIDFDGSADYTRSPGPAQDIEPALRKMLQNGLTYFNTWIEKQAGNDIRLAKSVKISFNDYSGPAEDDTIYYSPKRLLSWDDFRGGIPQSRFAAEVSPTIGYNETAEVKNGVVCLNIQMKVFLPKSACWVKEDSRNSYTLNHEQRHFDLAKIASIEFMRRLQSEKLMPANYDGPINVDYLDAYRRMDTLEKLYDDETQHGIDRFAQEKWNERIDRELKAYGVK